jgi:hypothetical protein
VVSGRRRTCGSVGARQRRAAAEVNQCALPVIVVIWLVIGVLAAYQRGYFSGDKQVNCAEPSTVLVTIVVGR